MRVIAGLYKGRRLCTPKGNWLRPTTDRNREFLFSYLGNWVEEVRILDLFAGIGSLGIEALSRGASSATFVDASYQAVQLLRKNLAWVHQPTQVFIEDAKAFLKKTALPVDIIFADPPYSFSEFADLMQIIQDRHLLSGPGLLVHEAGRKNRVEHPSGFRAVKRKPLGDTLITIYEIVYES